MERPQLLVTSITVGTDDAHGLATFYAGMLGWRITGDDPPVGDDPGWSQIKPPPDQMGPTINFEGERQFVRPVWPSTAGEQNATQHLDIWVQDLAAATAWAVHRGAVLADFQPQSDVRVLIDPGGHPFCLFT